MAVGGSSGIQSVPTETIRLARSSAPNRFADCPPGPRHWLLRSDTPKSVRDRAASGVREPVAARRVIVGETRPEPVVGAGHGGPAETGRCPTKPLPRDPPLPPGVGCEPQTSPSLA